MRRLEKGECHVLIMYDIVQTKRRSKYVTYLNGYGYRVQKSCFEAIITRKLLKQIIKDSPKFMDKSEDSIRIYNLGDRCRITNYGVTEEIPDDAVGIV